MQTLWPFLAYALLAVHLIAIQIASACPIVCCLLPRNAENPRSNRAAKRMASHSVVALLLGVSVGLLLGWLAMSQGIRDYTPVLTKFYNRIWWGGWELLFSLLVMLACWLPWNFWTASRGRRIFQGLLAIVTATNLLYHFPPLLTVMATELASVPDETTNVATITSAEFRALIAQPLVIAKSLHFGFAAIAVSGAWLMLFHSSTKQDGESPTDHPARRGAMIAVSAMAMQMLIGMWLVTQVPSAEQSALMGGDPIAAALLLASIVFSLGAMNQLGTIAMDSRDESTPRQIRFAAIGVLVIATTMICVAGRMSGLGG